MEWKEKYQPIWKYTVFQVFPLIPFPLYVTASEAGKR